MNIDEIVAGHTIKHNRIRNGVNVERDGCGACFPVSVVDLVGEAVGAVEICVRRVGEAAVIIEGEGAV
ncbi:hypothetical protein [Shimia sp. R9_1]|uniref:hypothetical protein n=1 Tax=Shimia sp. R9_1 TaxID=2821111 RepID=UPI001FFE00E8|nr:hypothetical protein [Shimia sp. R9_1]